MTRLTRRLCALINPFPRQVSQKYHALCYNYSVNDITEIASQAYVVVTFKHCVHLALADEQRHNTAKIYL